MRCLRCNKSVDEVMLHRTTPKGATPANWMCMPCIEMEEPELSKNIKEEVVLTDLERIFYNKGED